MFLKIKNFLTNYLLLEKIDHVKEKLFSKLLYFVKNERSEPKIIVDNTHIYYKH